MDKVEDAQERKQPKIICGRIEGAIAVNISLNSILGGSTRVSIKRNADTLRAKQVMTKRFYEFFQN
ncbi:MAG: hypothetical protein ABJQ70_05825 [Roseobacter sp.]